MPHTINGIGSWYYGRNNVHRHAAMCEFCNNYGLLSSYDTTLFFTFLFVPVIPLKKMHVIDECPSCSKHRALSLREWEELREKTLTESFAAYRGNLRDEKKAIEAVLATTSFRHQEAFDRVAPIVRENLPNSADVNTILAGAHEFFGDQRGAAAAYRRSLDVKPDDENVRRALAVVLLRLGKPDEAAPLIADVLTKKDPQHLALLYLLVEGYQSAGRHQNALHLLDDIVAAFPDLAGEKTIKRYRKTSEKHRGSGKPIASPNLRVTSGAAVEKGRFATLPRLIAPLLVLVALAIFAAVSFAKASSRPVHFINGVTRDYDIEVNGVRHTLHGGQRQILNVREGDVRVRALDPSLGISDQVLRVRTSFWARPFTDNHFVINPDRAAILYVEMTEYSANPDHDRPMPVTFRTGDSFYDFSDVDYAFEQFPQWLKGTGGVAIAKRRCDQHPSEPLDSAFITLLRHIGKDAAGQFARRQLDANPEKTELLSYLRFALPPSDALAYIRPHLSRRPVSIEWHRNYQELMENHHPEHDLYAEYKPLYEKDPRDAGLAYLLGRIAPDKGESRRLLEQAADATPPSGRALGALAYDSLSSANFRAALEYARKALATAPEDDDFRHMETEALLALGQYQALIERAAAKATEGSGSEFLWRKDEAHLRTCSGDAAGARAVVATFMATLPPQMGPQMREQLRLTLNAAVAYASGDPSGYAAIPPESAIGTDKFVVAVCGGRLTDAAAALDEIGLGVSAAAVEPYLTLHLAAHVAGQSDLQRKYLDLAIQSLRKDDAEARKLADHLAGASRPQPASVVELRMFPSRKRLALAALAVCFPEDRANYAELARPYNYNKHFPHLLLKQVLEGR